MSEKKTYTVMILGDDSAQPRQFSISRNTITYGILGFTAVVIGIVAFAALSLSSVQWPGHSATQDALKSENKALKLANDRYLEASIEMENRLRLFEERTAKLAQFVGVEATAFQAGGIGGPDLLENELNPYLRYDLGLLENRAQVLEDQHEVLEEAFHEQSTRLDATPSILPARGWISSGYKYRTDPFTGKRTFHAGIDISAPEGTPIHAPANGVVTFRGYQGGFGNTLVITHGNNIKTRYGHLYKFNVSKGQRVKRGDLIGYVGSTGRSTGTHLHYEVHKDDRSINPMKYIIREQRAL